MRAKRDDNNFDLIRLFAASQVMVVHVMGNLPGSNIPALRFILDFVPGVPIFFFISGFLVSASWIRSRDLVFFASSRALRIFPALWVAFGLSLILVLTFFGPELIKHLRPTLAWVFAQLTFMQSWNPEFLRGYGTGLVNAALWTIPVELAFYFVTPLLCAGTDRRRQTVVLVLVIAVSLALNTYFSFYFMNEALASNEQRLIQKVALLSPLSFVCWIWMFAFGILAQLHFDWLRRLVYGRFIVLLVVAAVISVVSVYIEIPGLLRRLGNSVGLLNFVTQALVVLAFAYSYDGLSRSLIGSNDISYGIYIFHYPVLNLLFICGLVGLPGLAANLALTVCLAFVSWKLVEAPALRLRTVLRVRRASVAVQ